MCALHIHINMKRPYCLFCHATATPIGPLLSDEDQHFECPDPKCTVTGFILASDGELLGIWLGKLPYRKDQEQSDDQVNWANLDLRSVAVLMKKREIWSQLCEQFIERKEKTTIEQRAIRKLRDWCPQYGGGYPF
jgi:hypothetical protein